MLDRILYKYTVLVHPLLHSLMRSQLRLLRDMRKQHHHSLLILLLYGGCTAAVVRGLRDTRCGAAAAGVVADVRTWYDMKNTYHILRCMYVVRLRGTHQHVRVTTSSIRSTLGSLIVPAADNMMRARDETAAPFLLFIVPFAPFLAWIRDPTEVQMQNSTPLEKKQICLWKLREPL